MEAKNVFISFCTASEKFSKYLVYALFGLLTVFLSTVSIFSTAYFALDYNEHPLYESDSPVMLLGIFAVLAILIFLFDKKFGIDRINTRILLGALMVYTAAVAVLWLYNTKSFPVADQKSVRDIAEQFYMDEYYSLEKGNYLYIYPYQLGIAAFIELSYTIFGRDSLLLLHIFNVLSPCLAFYSLYRITDLTFHCRKINNLVIFLLFGCFPPILYCTFVYGNSMGLAFSLAAVWMQMKYFNSGRIRFVVLSALFIAFAVMVRTNSWIVLVAMAIMFFLKFLNTRKARNLLLPLLVIAAVCSSAALLRAYYESRAGIEINDGAPKILWFAMGLQESSMAPGWYNGFSLYPYTQNDCDAEAAAEMARQSIRESLHRFREDPGYALRFFTYKFASQWNEPTYQSLWVSRTHLDGEEIPEVVTSFFEGRLHFVAVGFMNIYHFIIAFGAMCFLILQNRKIKTDQLFLGLIVFGGFLFHMLWEAKAQYIMTYFTMLVPFAGAGIYSVIELIGEKCKGLKKRS